MYYYNENIEKVRLHVWSYAYEDGITETLIKLINDRNTFYKKHYPDKPQLFPQEERYLKETHNSGHGLCLEDYTYNIITEQFTLPFELKYGDVIGYDVLIPLTEHAAYLQEALGFEQAYFVCFGNRYWGVDKEGKQLIDVRLEMIWEDFLGENDLFVMEKIRKNVK